MSAKEDIREVKETLDEVKTVVPIASEIVREIGKAVKFIIHCFGCKNKKGTPVLLKHDSVEYAATRNSVQVRGVCATCGKNVRGFISKALAKEMGYEAPPPAKEARKAEASGDAEPAAKRPATTAVVGEAEPAQENKQ